MSDDDTTIDADWLTRIGCKPSNIWAGAFMYDGFHLRLNPMDAVPCWVHVENEKQTDYVTFHHVHTRGQFRQLTRLFCGPHLDPFAERE